MGRTTRAIVATVVAGVLAGGQCLASPPELEKVHILMVVDSDDETLSTSVKIDKLRMKRLWLSTIPKDRYSLTILEGKEVNRRNVLGHYEKLEAGKGEGLVFYYAGHGNREAGGGAPPDLRQAGGRVLPDPLKGTGRHFFDLSNDRKPLFRADVRKAMEARNPRPPLVVLLTDCCSTPRKLARMDTERAIGTPAEKLHPTVRCLFFQARGTVDITAATDNASWSDNARGGLFTRSLERLLAMTPLEELDRDRDGFVSWNEFFPQLVKETTSLFGAWRKELLARGDVNEEVKRDLNRPRTKQVPHAFALREAGRPGQTYAVVGIENANRTPLRYSYRWEGRVDWTDAVLAAGEKKVHARPVPGGSRRPSGPQRAAGKLPRLEVRLGTSSKVTPFEATGWSGGKPPGVSDLEKFFRVQRKERSGTSEPPR